MLSLDYFAQLAIHRRPTIHDIIHYVAWMGYIQETKYYPSTCKEAAEHVEFAFANSRATYGLSGMNRLQIVCRNAWSSPYMKSQEEWARTVKDHERWGHKTSKGFVLFSVSKAKYDIAWRKTRVETLLRLASAYAPQNLVKVVNQKNVHGWTPLHTAVYTGSLEHVKLLLDAGAVMYPELLHLAIDSEYHEVLTELLRRGARTDALDKQNKTPLQVAVHRNAIGSAKILLELGMDPAPVFKDAIEINFEDPLPMISLLCKYGADPNMTYENGRTPLMIVAASNLQLKNSIKPLLKVGAQIDLRDDMGQTALLIAVVNEEGDVVKELLECGANTQIMSDNGFLPIDVTDDMTLKCLIGRAALKKRFAKSSHQRRPQ